MKKLFLVLLGVFAVTGAVANPFRYTVSVQNVTFGNLRFTTNGNYVSQPKQNPLPNGAVGQFTFGSSNYLLVTLVMPDNVNDTCQVGMYSKSSRCYEGVCVFPEYTYVNQSTPSNSPYSCLVLTNNLVLVFKK